MIQNYEKFEFLIEYYYYYDPQIIRLKKILNFQIKIYYY